MDDKEETDIEEGQIKYGDKKYPLLEAFPELMQIHEFENLIYHLSQVSIPDRETWEKHVWYSNKLDDELTSLADKYDAFEDIYVRNLSEDRGQLITDPIERFLIREGRTEELRKILVKAGTIKE